MIKKEKIDEVSIIERMEKKELLYLLENAWTKEGIRFSKEEYYIYLKWLDYFEKSSESIELVKEDIKKIVEKPKTTKKTYSRKPKTTENKEANL